MKLNADKCHLLISGFKHQLHWIDVGTDRIWESSSEKLLGVTIDKHLRLNSHVTNLCRNASQKLTALGRLSKLLNMDKRREIFKAFIEAQFSHCPLVWLFHDRELNVKVNRLQERALRLVYRDSQSSFDELLERDNSVSIHHRNIQLLAVELYKIKNNLSNDIISEIFTDRIYAGPGLRKQTDFLTPPIKSVYKGESSLRYLGPLIWNILPNHFKEIRTLGIFKEQIKSWKPSECPCRLCKTYVHGVGFI